jgi:hypothetical protein
MTALTDYCAVLRDWIDDQDPSDALVTSWIRDGEQRINDELRSVEQITREKATFDDNCAPLPPDWLECLYVKLVGGNVFRYVTPDAYWQMNANPGGPLMVNDPTSQPAYPGPGSWMVYTIIGQTLFVLPSIDPEALTKIEIGYFRKIMPMEAVADALVARYPVIMRSCALTAAAPYLVEDDRLNTWAGLATAGIAKANESARAGRWSGSPLTPVIRGFG